jgi:hypothetical protein
MNALPVFVLTLWFAAPGKPPSPEEQRLFDEGMRAFQAGNPGEADKVWRAGYALARDPAFLVRMGEAEEKAGQPAEAAESYRRYLGAAPDAADRAEIEQRLSRLGPAGAPPTGVAVPADAHETAGAFGAGGPAPGETPAPPPAASVPARDDELARRAARDDEPSGWTPVNVTAWIATGATVMLLGVAGYYAASAGSQKDDVNLLLRFQDPMTGAPLEYQTVAARYQQAVRNGQHDDRVAKEALVAAAGTALIATALFIVDAVRAPDPRIERKPARGAITPHLGFQLRPGNGQAAAVSSLRWSF